MGISLSLALIKPNPEQLLKLIDQELAQNKNSLAIFLVKQSTRIVENKIIYYRVQIPWLDQQHRIYYGVFGKWYQQIEINPKFVTKK